MSPRFRILALVLVLLSGCSPVLSQTVIDESLQFVSLADLQERPETYRHQSILLGGTVLRVINDDTGHRAEILQRPLGNRLEPLLDDTSRGRFLIQHDQFLDPQIFYKGRKITVAGPVLGTETRPLDQTTYTYPVLQVREYYLWPGEYGRYRSPVYFSIGIWTSF